MMDLKRRLGRELVAGLWELLYPFANRCPFCRQRRRGETGICPDCLAEVRAWKGRYQPCHRCGRLLHGPGLCRDCRPDPPPFRWARAAGVYEGHLRQALQQLKYYRRRRLAAPLGRLLLLALEEAPPPIDFDLVVPVPLSPRRLAERSFNQSALLARELARARSLPLAEPLVRTRETPPQVGLSRANRMVNLAGAFAVPDPQAVAGASILLVDDTLTTGATVRECSRVLLAAGARTVCVVTVATAFALT
ncbi:MAG: ComF family protein [Clostridia bacterium]|jgi:ComF family protein|nr:ComF family protein [Clostridia bacterium]MDH7573986.1 ComF family protein [Clostridia bacterium]